MPRLPSARPSKLTAEERRLQREAEELRRKEQELERQLRMLPAKIEAQRSREQRLVKMRAHTAAPAISLDGTRGSRNSKSGSRRKPLPTRELQNAKIKFFVLLLILATIAMLLWRSIPS